MPFSGQRLRRASPLRGFYMDARFRYSASSCSRNIIKMIVVAAILLLKMLLTQTLLLIMLLLCSQYLDSMLVLLREVFLMPGEEVLRAGQSSLQLAFVISGRAEELHGEVVQNVIRSDVDTCSSILTVIACFVQV